MAVAALDVLGGVLLAVYGQVLAARLADPGSLASRLIGTLGVLAGVVGGALYGAIPIGMTFLGAAAPDPSTYRYVLATSAAVMVVYAAIPAAGLVAVASVQGLRPRRCPGGSAWPGSS